MTTRTVQIELSPGSTQIVECPNCLHETLITADILVLRNTGIKPIATYRHCEQCEDN